MNTVRNRMKSVKNIQKITKAMKMVAASKLRAIQVRAENSRGLWQPFTALLGDIPSMYMSYVSYFILTHELLLFTYFVFVVYYVKVHIILMVYLLLET